MSEQYMEKIIGAAYVVDKEKFFAADIYEGNYYKLVEGGVVKTVGLPKKEYDRCLLQYQERLKKDEMITCAYELNKKAGHEFDVPKITADPEAAEKEWYLRKHPQVVITEEPVKKGFFRKRKKKPLKIKCLACGSINMEGQKFCGACGKPLLAAEEKVESWEVSSEDQTIIEDAEQREDEKEVLLVVEEVKEPSEEYEDFSQDKKENPEAIKDPEIPPEKDERPIDQEDVEESIEPPKKKKKKGIKVFVFIVLFMLVLGMGVVVFIYPETIRTIIYDSSNTPKVNAGAEAVTAVSEEAETTYVAIKVKNKITQNAKIGEEDLEGTILSKEQYEKYNAISTYIDKDGKSRSEQLLLWEEKDKVIGKYATKELTAGSILYDTSITSEHVVADKTYVDVEVDGENKTYESKSDVLPGNTKIQIVALILTDGKESESVLLSEMTLKDRSLESIFDSAGQDILEMLSDTEKQPEEKEQNNTNHTGTEPGGRTGEVNE